jgi:hypothetical protein
MKKTENFEKLTKACMQQLRKIQVPSCRYPHFTSNRVLDDSHFYLKVYKIENFFGSDFEFCVISLLVMLKY